MRGLVYSALAGVMGLALLDAITSPTGEKGYSLVTGGFAKAVQRFLDPTEPLIPDYSHSQADLQAIYAQMIQEAQSVVSGSEASSGASTPSSVGQPGAPDYHGEGKNPYTGPVTPSSSSTGQAANGDSSSVPTPLPSNFR